jgi:hypothetical protein
MSVHVVVVRGRARLTWRRRLAALLAVGVARLLSTLPPRRLAAALRLLRAGARPAGAAEAAAARLAVTTVSTYCAGEGCLPRATATALLCRVHGTWPTWRVGVRTEPFAAHAWVEAGDAPVGEPFEAGYYHPILTIPPLKPRVVEQD